MNQHRPGAFPGFLPGWKALATEPKIREGWFVPESLNALILLGAAGYLDRAGEPPGDRTVQGEGEGREAARLTVRISAVLQDST